MGGTGDYTVELSAVADDAADNAATTGRLEAPAGVAEPGLSVEEAQSVALLYEAGLGRQAAFLGLNFWIDRFEAGNSLTRIAQSFLDSDEFADTVGDPLTLTDGEFIDGLFENVIGRPPNPPGFEFWTGRLADGATRAQTLLAFAIEPENADQSPEVLTLQPIGDADGPADDPDDALIDDAFAEWDFVA